MNRAVALFACAIVAQSLDLWAGQTARPPAGGAVRQEPAEFMGPPKRIPQKPSPVLMRFAQSEVMQKVGKDDPKTLKPALEALNAFVTEAPHEPLIRFIRATVACEAGAPANQILEDIVATQSDLTTAESRALVQPQSVLSLKAKTEFALGQYDAAMRDLDAAIRDDYDDAMDVFNDGEVEPSLKTKPCAWTLPDLEQLATRFPDDYRPPLYQGLYTSLYLRFKDNPDHSLVISAYERAAKLNPKSPLPHYYLGTLHAFGSIGGLLSMPNAQCLEDIAPESEACRKLAQIRKLALRYFTSAIAVDPSFEPAYSSRAALLLRLKEYRQAIRDYSRALELNAVGNERRIVYNDRALAKMQLGDYAGAIPDLNKSIAIGCDFGCGSYNNRAEAYLKIGNYTAALADVGASIKQAMSNAIFLINIDSFRKLYPEYDDVGDEVIAEKMRALFYPEMTYEVFSRQFLIEAKMEPTFILSELYLKRGDVYAKLGRTRDADAEYDRVQRVFPKFYEIAFDTVNGKRVRVKD